MDVSRIVATVLTKSELSTLDPPWVAERVIRLAHSHRIRAADLDNPRSAGFSTVVKAARKELRDLYGNLWLGPPAARSAALARLLAQPTLAHHRALLALHRSTRERLEGYPTLYRRLFALTGQPASLLDLSCGYNPFSWPYLGCQPTYTGTELARADCAFLNQYFEGLRLPGHAEAVDLWHGPPTLPVADAALLFKLADALETQRRGATFALLESLRCRFAIVSFATRSLGGRPFAATRDWFARGLARRHWRHEALALQNERFFVIWLV